MPPHSIWAACTVLTLNCQFVILLPTKKDQEILLCWDFQELFIHFSPKFWYPRILRCHDNRIITRRCDQISASLTLLLIFSQFLDEIDHFRDLSASGWKRVFVQNYSYSNGAHLEVYFHANQTHFQERPFARRVVLKQRQKATRKWPIT